MVELGSKARCEIVKSHKVIVYRKGHLGVNSKSHTPPREKEEDLLIPPAHSDGVFNIEKYADEECESSPGQKSHLCRECVVK